MELKIQLFTVFSNENNTNNPKVKSNNLVKLRLIRMRRKNIHIRKYRLVLWINLTSFLLQLKLTANAALIQTNTKAKLVKFAYSQHCLLKSLIDYLFRRNLKYSFFHTLYKFYQWRNLIKLSQRLFVPVFFCIIDKHIC